MIRASWFVAACLSILGTFARAEAEQRVRPNKITAFINVNVVPMDRERILSNQTVIVKGDRIAELGPASAVEIRKSAARIDGRGKYLMPGLADMHVHIGEEDQLLLFVANGVTTVRNMAGHPDHLSMRKRISSGDLLGPTIYTAGPIVDGDPPVWPESAVVASPEQARRVVDSQRDAGYDFIKVYGRLTLAAYEALVQAANEVGIPVVGHVPAEVGLDGALKARQRCIEHLDRYEAFLARDDCETVDEKGWGSLVFPWLEMDETKLDGIVRATREAGTWNCPTLVVLQKWVLPEEANAILKRKEFEYLSPDELAFHRPGGNYLVDVTPEMLEAAAAGDAARKKLTKALYDGGARILLGTDCPNPLIVPGFSIHEELRNFTDAGLTPYQAIKAGTHDAAEFFDALDQWGTVAVGRRADLILLEANPLDDVGNLVKRTGVMVRGKWFPQVELQARLDALAAKYEKAKGRENHDAPKPDVE
jgi:imidazolonepropionase-like amidohydrolase